MPTVDRLVKSSASHPSALVIRTGSLGVHRWRRSITIRKFWKTHRLIFNNQHLRTLYHYSQA
jgi:hypothetical protein